MKRKVNLVGNSTLTVSLPVEFVKKHRIQKGDELFAVIDDDRLTYSAGEKNNEVKEITLNVDALNWFSLARHMAALYRANYSKVALIYSKTEMIHEKKGKFPLKSAITELVDRFIGAEIISQTCTKTEIEFLIQDEKQELSKIQQRISFLIRETFDEIIEATQGDYNEFHPTVGAHHNNIVKFINYYLRELSYADWSEYEKSAAYALYLMIDKGIDKIRHLSERIEKHGITEKAKKYAREVFDFYCEQFEVLTKHNYQEIIDKRYRLVNKINNESFTVKEHLVVGHLDIFLNSLTLFIEFAIVRGLNKK